MNRGHKKQAAYGRILWVIAIISIVITGSRLYIDAQNARIQKGIAGEIIRFHVRANSDSQEDQDMKMEVKASVLEYISPKLSQSESIDESRQILEQESDNIAMVAKERLQSLGSDYDVNVYFENGYFPMKSYGDVTFPPGEYEAFRVDIGKAEGKNWWCVLYPPLCFVDAAYGVVPDESKNELKGVLTEEEYNTVTGNNNQYRFKYLTFFNKYMK